MPQRLQSCSYKPLPNPIAVPTNPAIGRQLTSLIPAGAVKLGHTEEQGDSVRFAIDTFDFDGDGRADARLSTWSKLAAPGVVDSSVLKIARPGADRQQTCFATATGKIDQVIDGNEKNSTWTMDQDHDGRVDKVLMQGTDMGTFTLDGHTGTPLDDHFKPIAVQPGTLPPEIVARAFEDTDGDGRFDQEFVGGPWWSKPE